MSQTGQSAGPQDDDSWADGSLQLWDHSDIHQLLPPFLRDVVCLSPAPTPPQVPDSSPENTALSIHLSVHLPWAHSRGSYETTAPPCSFAFPFHTVICGCGMVHSDGTLMEETRGPILMPFFFKLSLVHKSLPPSIPTESEIACFVVALSRSTPGYKWGCSSIDFQVGIWLFVKDMGSNYAAQTDHKLLDQGDPPASGTS